VLDERYDPSPDALLDVYVPGADPRSGTALPNLTAKGVDVDILFRRWVVGAC